MSTVADNVPAMMMAEALREIAALRERRDELLEANNRYQQDASDARIAKGEAELMVRGLSGFNRDLMNVVGEFRDEHDAVLRELKVTGHDSNPTEKLNILVDRAIDKERERIASILQLILGLSDEDMIAVFNHYKSYEKIAAQIAEAMTGAERVRVADTVSPPEQPSTPAEI